MYQFQLLIIILVSFHGNTSSVCFSLIGRQYAKTNIFWYRRVRRDVLKYDSMDLDKVLILLEDKISHNFTVQQLLLQNVKLQSVLESTSPVSRKRERCYQILPCCLNRMTFKSQMMSSDKETCYIWSPLSHILLESSNSRTVSPTRCSSFRTEKLHFEYYLEDLFS